MAGKDMDHEIESEGGTAVDEPTPASPGGPGAITPHPSVAAGGEDGASLVELAQARYLNYALSVITSRALPDVRDGLKPVHRRIIYTMWTSGVRADAKHRKCAKVVGDGDGRLPPPRRLGDLRSPRADGPAVCDAMRHWSTAAATSGPWTATPRRTCGTPSAG